MLYPDAGGGNSSELTCSGQSGTPGASQLQNLTDLIRWETAVPAMDVYSARIFLSRPT